MITTSEPSTADTTNFNRVELTQNENEGSGFQIEEPVITEAQTLEDLVITAVTATTTYSTTMTTTKIFSTSTRFHSIFMQSIKLYLVWQDRQNYNIDIISKQ